MFILLHRRLRYRSFRERRAIQPVPESTQTRLLRPPDPTPLATVRRTPAGALGRAHGRMASAKRRQKTCWSAKSSKSDLVAGELSGEGRLDATRSPQRLVLVTIITYYIGRWCVTIRSRMTKQLTRIGLCEPRCDAVARSRHWG